MINVQGLRRNVKNVVKNYSEAQVKVREATSNDPWGPSGTLMGEIADLTYNVVAFSEIMQVVWKRLNDHGKNWKHVYKALVLLEYLIKTGSEKVGQQCRENLFAIETLRDFRHSCEATGRDQGVNVREKAKVLTALLKDPERLRSERERALKARERFATTRGQHPPPTSTSTQRFGSTEFSGGSCDEDMMSPVGGLPLSELEQARPATAGEEDLQLQLALAMSREEAEQAERQKRNDDLRLQMALSESQEEFKKMEPPTHSQLVQSASAMDDLLGLNLPAAAPSDSPRSDPWGLPLSTSQPSQIPNDLDIWNNSNALPEQNHNSVVNNPWGPPVGNPPPPPPFPEEKSGAFDMSSMRKSVSADVGILDAFLSSESSLLNSTNPRTRTMGNPFQAARPSPPTINEMRASQSFPISNDTTLPMQAFHSAYPPTQPPQNNPFM